MGREVETGGPEMHRKLLQRQDERSRCVYGLRNGACFSDKFIMVWSLIRLRD